MTKPFIHIFNNILKLLTITHSIDIRFHRVGVRHVGLLSRGAHRESLSPPGTERAQVGIRAITSGPRRDTRISIINFVRDRDGVLRPPPVRVKPGSSPSSWLALGTPLRQWPPAALNVSDDVWGPPSGRRSATAAVLML